MKRSASKPSEPYTPSLFDEPEASSPVVEDVADEADADELEDWQEVSQARFLSWSDAMQLHYCWRRDLDAATRADNNEDAKFFLQRAAAYKSDLDNLKGES